MRFKKSPPQKKRVSSRIIDSQSLFLLRNCHFLNASLLHLFFVRFFFIFVFPKNHTPRRNQIFFFLLQVFPFLFFSNLFFFFFFVLFFFFSVFFCSFLFFSVLFFLLFLGGIHIVVSIIDIRDGKCYRNSNMVGL